jgi:hypothetical protein
MTLVNDYLQGFMVALGSGTVVVCWRWLEPVRAGFSERYRQRQELRQELRNADDEQNIKGD